MTEKKTQQKNNSFFDGLALMALSAFLLCHSVYHQYTDRVHYDWSLSPYLFPTILSCVLLLLSVVLLKKGSRSRKKENGKPERKATKAIKEETAENKNALSISDELKPAGKTEETTGFPQKEKEETQCG